MKYLTVSSVLKIHEKEISFSNGLDGIRDYGLLESAVSATRQTFFGKPFYHDCFEAASSYIYHIIKNHPFVDGNKRTGFGAYIAFMDNNGYECIVNEDELYNFVISVADGSLGFNGIVQKTKQMFKLKEK